jgi:hypothetical protein
MKKINTSALNLVDSSNHHIVRSSCESEMFESKVLAPSSILAPSISKKPNGRVIVRMPYAQQHLGEILAREKHQLGEIPSIITINPPVITYISRWSPAKKKITHAKSITSRRSTMFRFARIAFANIAAWGIIALMTSFASTASDFHKTALPSPVITLTPVKSGQPSNATSELRANRGSHFYAYRISCK